MSQIFHPSTNTISKVTIIGLLILVGGTLWLFAEISNSPWVKQQTVVRQQPVPFSHEHHVTGLGLDCRYCHSSVEKSSVAGVPPTETCMTCHSQIWTNAAMLEPIRQSYRTGKPMKWNRVHDLPDFVYFDHSIHVTKGIGCESCHGRVDKMPLMQAVSALNMAWCLDCHRHPEKNIRPRDQVFKMGYVPATPQAELGPKLVKEYNVNVRQLTNCSICHR